MLKVQSAEEGSGWAFRTRAGSTLADAWPVLAAFRRNWPGERHRLVDVSTGGGVTVIADDVEALALADETAAAGDV